MRLVIAVLALVLAVLFAVQNTDVVNISLLLWQVNASVAVIMVVCLAIGLLVGLVSLAPAMYRGRSNARRLRQQLAELDAVDAGPTARDRQIFDGATSTRRQGSA